MKKGFLIGAFWGTLLGALILLVAAVAFVAPGTGPAVPGPDPVLARGIGDGTIILLSTPPEAGGAALAFGVPKQHARLLVPRPRQVRMPQMTAFPPLARVDDVLAAPNEPPVVIAMPGHPEASPLAFVRTAGRDDFVPPSGGLSLATVPQGTVPRLRPDLVGGVPAATVAEPDWAPVPNRAPILDQTPVPIPQQGRTFERTLAQGLPDGDIASPGVPKLPEPAVPTIKVVVPETVTPGSSPARVAFVLAVQRAEDATDLPVWIESVAYPVDLFAGSDRVSAGRDRLVLLQGLPSVAELEGLSGDLKMAGAVVVGEEFDGETTAEGRAFAALLRQTGAGVLGADKTRPAPFLAARAAGLRAGLVYAGFSQTPPGPDDLTAIAERARRDGQVVVMLGPDALAGVGEWLSGPEGQALSPVPVSELLN